LRYDQWKVVFLEQQHEGIRVWQEPLVPLRAPLFLNLRADPFERAVIESGEYEKWYVERMFLMGAGSGDRGQGNPDPEGISSATKAGELFGRRRAAEADERRAEQRQLTP
jgi:hypothetical protein